MNLSLRTRLFNYFRNIFRVPLLGSLLASMTEGKSPQHLVCKLVPNPYQYPPGTIRMLNRNGIAMRVDMSDYIGHYLFFGFADSGMDKLFSLCKADSTVLDVGANIGWTVLNMANIARQGKVLGFEPDPYNFERCSQNMLLNDFKNGSAYPLGLGNENRAMNIEIRTISNRGGNRIAPGRSGDTRMVEVVRLDDFSLALELPKIDLIKIDVEGYELNVLRGAERLLKKHKPILFLELDDNNLIDQGDSALALIQFLGHVGYAEICHALDESKITATTNFSNCHFDIIAK